MDRAWDKVAETVIDAEDLWMIDPVDKDRYECVGCDIKMWPTSFLRVNKRRPHFRQASEHQEGCDVQEEAALVKRARTEQIPDEQLTLPGYMPNRLNLRPKTTEEDPAGAPEDVRLPNGRKNAGSLIAGGGKRHSTSASTIRRLCRAYANFPHNRHSPLVIDGVSGRSYAEIFAPLMFDKIIHYDQPRLRFAQIAWTAKHISSEDWFEITLSVGNREAGKVVTPYRVRANWKDWSKRARTSLEIDVEVVIEENKAARKAGGKEAGWLFFIGHQDPNDNSLFHVDDQRVICTLFGEIVSSKNSRQSARNGRT